jgi:hypothetical protein
VATAVKVRRRLAVVLLALAAAGCAPVHDRPAPAPGTAHGVAVDGRLTAKAGDPAVVATRPG